MRFFLLFSGWDDHTDRGNASILGVDPPFEIQNGLERFWKQKKKQAESEAGSSNWPLGNGAILFFPFYSLLLPFYSTCIPSFPGGSDSKVSACNVGDSGLNPGLGRSPGEGNSNPLQYSWLEIPWMVAYQVPLSIGFSRQAYWNGLPFPSPGDLPNPGFKPGSPALQADSLPTEPPGSPNCCYTICWKDCVFSITLPSYLGQKFINRVTLAIWRTSKLQALLPQQRPKVNNNRWSIIPL